MSKVIIHRHAAKYFNRLPQDTRDQVKETLKQLENNPTNKSGIKKMYGEWSGYHRLRTGKLRIIFWYDSKEDVVYVDHIGPRGDVYK